MYTPAPPAQTKDPQEIINWAYEELNRLAGALQTMQISHVEYQVHYVAPPKPRAGQVYYADGTNWNPGSGEGLYRRSVGGSWVFIG